jgi:hypothetical protein
VCVTNSCSDYSNENNHPVSKCVLFEDEGRKFDGYHALSESSCINNNNCVCTTDNYCHKGECNEIRSGYCSLNENKCVIVSELCSNGCLFDTACSQTN